MNSIRAFFATRTGRLIVHDGTLALGAGLSAWEAAGQSWTWGAAVAAGVVAGKAFLRLILPVPAAGQLVGVKVRSRKARTGRSSPVGTTGNVAGNVTLPLGGGFMYNVTTTTTPTPDHVVTAVPDLTVVLPERKVAGKRLGRHVHHDERSRAYPFTPRHTGPLVSVRHKRNVAPFDQGDLGSCTGNACAGALSTAPFTHRFGESRAVKIYEAATVLDDVPGSYPPDDTGSDGLSVAKVAVRNGWATRYEHCFDLPSVLAALQVGPVMLGVNWRTGFDNPAGDGRMAYTGSVRGGHEICADEIDVVNKRVWITNSWSASWGVKGRAYWTWADLAKVLADQGDATVLLRT